MPAHQRRSVSRGTYSGGKALGCPERESSHPDLAGGALHHLANGTVNPFENDSSGRSSCQTVKETIVVLPPLPDVIAKTPFVDQADLLEHSAGGWIVGEVLGVDPVQIQRLQPVSHHGLARLGGIPIAHSVPLAGFLASCTGVAIVTGIGCGGEEASAGSATRMPCKN